MLMIVCHCIVFFPNFITDFIIFLLCILPHNILGYQVINASAVCLQRNCNSLSLFSGMSSPEKITLKMNIFYHLFY